MTDWQRQTRWRALNRTVHNRAGFHHEGFGWGVLYASALFTVPK